LIFRSVGFISAFDKTKLCSHSGEILFRQFPS
jgi:hypothetical protein